MAGHLHDAERSDLDSGAHWYRVDFHLHTPGVNSFTSPPGLDFGAVADRRKVAEEYASRLANAGVGIAAITDYNGVRVEWFEPIRRAAEERGVTVLPGAEIDIREGKGLHVLAVFPQDTEAERVNEYLRGMNVRVEDLVFEGGKHEEITPRESLADALKWLRTQTKCLLIPAHVGEDKGLVKSLGPKRAAELIRHRCFDAIEHVDSASLTKLRSLLSEAELASLARVEFSDPKRLQDVGTKVRANGKPRATWLKLSSLDIDALRLALHDPQTRLSKTEPDLPNHARLLRMSVEGSGFLGNAEIRWNPDLNVLVGGRGAGKSAILEVLRYALDAPIYADQSSRLDLVKHALGSGGQVSLEFERPGRQGSRYEVRRVLNEPPRVKDLTLGQLVDAEPTELFGPASAPLILLQREIQAVAGDDRFRLSLLDLLIGDGAQKAQRTVRDVETKLETNARAIVDSTRRLERRSDYQERLRTAEREIEFYEKEGVAPKLSEHTALAGDEALLDGAATTVADATTTWERTVAPIVDDITSARSGLQNAHSKCAPLLSEAAALLDRLSDRLLAAQTSGLEALREARDSLKQVRERFGAERAPLDDELRRLQQELQTDALDPDRLFALVRERTTVEPLLADLDKLAQREQQLRDERLLLIAQLADARLAAHALRRKQADAVNERLQGKLRITVEYKGQAHEYREMLTNLLKGSRVGNAAIASLIAPEGTDGSKLAAAVREGEDALEEGFGIGTSSARSLTKWLLDDERRFFQLEQIAPSDNVRVELQVGEAWRPLDRLSMGQRATAMLLMLFALEGRLLVLDQPEDDLDNRFVYDDVVTMLRHEKGLDDQGRRRQVIAATHNPNIPVLGDAEQVLVLQADAQRTSIETRASIDAAPVRTLLRTILEGGAEAFRRRAEKYGGIE